MDFCIEEKTPRLFFSSYRDIKERNGLEWEGAGETCLDCLFGAKILHKPHNYKSRATTSASVPGGRKLNFGGNFGGNFGNGNKQQTKTFGKREPHFFFPWEINHFFN